MKGSQFKKHNENPSSPNDGMLSRRRLLENYQKRVSELAMEQEDLLRQLDNYSRCCEDEHKLTWEVRQREDEVEQLQRALRDMQSYLLKEREHVLRLHSSNDKLKLRAHEDSKKIEHLIQLCGLSPEDARHFVSSSKSLPSTVVVRRETDAVPMRKWISKYEHEARLRERDALRVQVQSLEAQLSEQGKLFDENKRAIDEDDRIRSEELRTLSQRNDAKIKLLNEKAKAAQEIMYNRTQDFLDKRFRFRDHEKEWMAEKDHLLKDVSKFLSHQRKSDENKKPTLAGSPFLMQPWNAVTKECVRRTEEDYKQAARDLEWQVEQQIKLTDMYREQIVQMEGDLEKYQSKGEISKKAYHERSEKMSNRLHLMTKRYQELEQRRGLEVEGFQNDLWQIRQKLRKMESQLYKLTAGLTDPLEAALGGEGIELAILERVQRTAQESNRITYDMKRLKEMMFVLEDALKDS